jgi:hypothetical protein
MCKKSTWSSFKVIRLLVIGLVFFYFYKSWSSELPPRIDSVVVYKKESFHLEMVPGLATLMRFPCRVERAIEGNKSVSEVVLNEQFPKDIVVSLKAGTKLATNLIVTCTNNPNPFVFDIHPNQNHHRDVLVISRQAQRSLLPSLVKSKNKATEKNRPGGVNSPKTKTLLPGKVITNE